MTEKVKLGSLGVEHAWVANEFEFEPPDRCAFTNIALDLKTQI
jgi:hypothetical protein